MTMSSKILQYEWIAYSPGSIILTSVVHYLS